MGDEMWSDENLNMLSEAFRLGIELEDYSNYRKRMVESNKPERQKGPRDSNNPGMKKFVSKHKKSKKRRKR